MDQSDVYSVPVPVGGAAGANEPGEAQSISAMAAIYQTDQSVNASVLATVLSMLGAAIAYLVTTVAFTESLQNVAGGWLLVLLPVPLVIIGGYQALITSTSMLRSISARIIEHELVHRAGLQKQEAYLGARTADMVLDAYQAESFSMKATSFIVYGGEWLLIITYTIYMLAVSFRGQLHLWTFIPTAAYAGVGVIIALAWIDGQRLVARHRRALPPDVSLSAAG